MIIKMSKGYQLTIPANWRGLLGLKKETLINIELDKKSKRVIIEPLVTIELKTLYKEADNMKEHKLSQEDLKKIEVEIYE